jgi:glycosyltransferase 2 family protein
MRINGRLVIGIVIGLLALALILKDVSLPGLMRELAKANYWWMIPNVAAVLVGMWARAVRWRALLDERLSTRRAFHIQNAGNLLNNVLPLRLGEFAKAYLASRDSPVTAMQALSTVVIERLLDVLVVFAMLLVVLPYVPARGLIVHAAQILAAIAFLGIVGLFVAAAFRERALALARVVMRPLPPRVREGLIERGDDFLRGVSGASGKRLVTAIAWSIVTWIGFGSSCWFSVLAFVPGAPWHVGGFVNCAIALGLTIPSAPSGAGLYEAAAVAGLVVFGVAEDTGLASALVLHVSTYLVAAVVGVIGLDREGESFKHLATAARGMLGRRTEPGLPDVGHG